MTNTVTYIPLSSSVNPSFWSKLMQQKLDVYKSNEIEKHIWGYPSTIENSNCGISLLEVDSTSFNTKFTGQNGHIVFHGKLMNKNTIEKFKECDKQRLINLEGSHLYDRIKNGEALKDPTLLNYFILITFADIKKYHFYYWFAFPVPQGLSVDQISSCNIADEFSDEAMSRFSEEYIKIDDIQKSYFIIFKTNDIIQISSLFESMMGKMNVPDDIQIYFVYSNVAPGSAIGSYLRNYIGLILHYCPFLGGKILKFLSINTSKDQSKNGLKKSTVHKLKLPEVNVSMYFNWVGWEKNERDNNGPRLANMKNTLDPLVIAETSVDLNLKLMKWNLLPTIDLEKIKNTKCLLLGAGTLGCSVARTLLGWGVRYITFVDNATVSSSNPVRQSLFTYQDSVDSKPKAVAAADALKNIFPGVTSKGYEMTIPMPGHPIGESFLQETKEHVQKLTELVNAHDIIFLLMDSRESRWLPTLLGSIHQKIVINAALGFDSYLVMRHGISSDSVENPACNVKDLPDGFKSIKGSELGCYFCNDVTAPGDSLKNRTLDQQCTVTRPGVSLIAGALAAELAVSVLQHKEGLLAPAFFTANQNANNQNMEKLNPSVLGLIPHSIRGFLSSLEQFLPATQKYKNCVACSKMVEKEYITNGFNFLMEVFNNSKHLEDVTMLTNMCAQLNMDEVFEYDADEAFSGSSSDRDYGS